MNRAHTILRTLLAVTGLALWAWSSASCTTVRLTSVMSATNPPAIEKLMVIVRNDRFPNEGRRVRRAAQRALQELKITNRCIYVPMDLDPEWVEADIARFKPDAILFIQLAGIVITEREGRRAHTQYDASLAKPATRDHRIWRARVVADEGFDADPEDRSDETAKRIVEQLVRDQVLYPGS